MCSSRSDIESLLSVEEGLSDWEVRFAESIKDQMDAYDDWEPSDAQKKKLDEILERLGL